MWMSIKQTIHSQSCDSMKFYSTFHNIFKKLESLSSSYIFGYTQMSKRNGVYFKELTTTNKETYFGLD